MQPLRAALVGCGNISSHHMKTFQPIAGAAGEVEAIYESIRMNAPVDL